MFRWVGPAARQFRDLLYNLTFTPVRDTLWARTDTKGSPRASASPLKHIVPIPTR